MLGDRGKEIRPNTVANMEGVQARVQEAITNLVTTLDKEHFRKMQAQMYHCSAKCCENPHYKMEDVQRCIDQCNVPVGKGQEFMQTELGNFQNRLQRCAMDCQDKVRDRVSDGSSDAEVAKLRNEMEACVVKCGDSHIALVPSMLKRMKQVLQKNS